MSHISDVEAFFCIVRHGTIAAAARQLDLAPISVRKRLERLEAHLGITLISRYHRNMGLTDDGKLLYNHLIGVFDGLDHALAMVSRGDDGSSGKLRVASNLPQSARQHVARLVTRFSEQHPQIEVDLDLTDTEINVVYGGYDIAITHSPPENPAGLVVRPLFSHWCLCATPEYLESHPLIRVPSDLREHECLLLDSPGTLGDTWTFFGATHNEAVQITGSMVTDDARVLREWLLAGMGVAVFCEMEVREEIQEGKLVQILPDYQMPEIRFYMAYDRLRNLPARTQYFKEYLVQSVAGSNGGLSATG